MKYLIALVLLAPLFFASNEAHAFMAKIDSVYADSCYQDVSSGITRFDSIAIRNKPDSNYCQFTGNGPTYDIAFKKYKSTELQPIKFGSNIFIWGKKDKNADSSAGQITFNRFSDLDGSLITSHPIILEDGLNTIPVPNGTWVYIELSLAGNEVKHATSYFIDAVALVQDTTPTKSVPTAPILVSSLSSYPNPFISNTNIRFELKTEGDVQLAVVDALGRETDRIVAGYEESGMHEIPLAIKTPGFYFVRLFLNGQPIGTPLKITSR